jgi:hypothetical protein
LRPVGALAMLLENYVVKEGLGNESVGRIVQINFKEKKGPHGPKTHPFQVIVDFPNCKIPEEKKLKPNMRAADMCSND